MSNFITGSLHGKVRILFDANNDVDAQQIFNVVQSDFKSSNQSWLKRCIKDYLRKFKRRAAKPPTKEKH